MVFPIHTYRKFLLATQIRQISISLVSRQRDWPFRRFRRHLYYLKEDGKGKTNLEQIRAYNSACQYNCRNLHKGKKHHTARIVITKNTTDNITLHFPQLNNATSLRDYDLIRSSSSPCNDIFRPTSNRHLFIIMMEFLDQKQFAEGKSKLVLSNQLIMLNYSVILFHLRSTIVFQKYTPFIYLLKKRRANIKSKIQLKPGVSVT